MSGSIFISAKREDLVFAREVYSFLCSQRIPCFFADEPLLAQGAAAYRRAIDEALEAAMHMVVVASSAEHLKSGWVSDEWRFFYNEIMPERKTGQLVTILCGELSPKDLPPTLRFNPSLRLKDGLDRLPDLLPGSVPPPLPPEETETNSPSQTHQSWQSLAPRQIIDRRYRLEEILGKGGSGVVWRAYDEELACPCALKFLKEEYVFDPSAVAEIKDELLRSRDLTHPHIIRVFDLVQDRKRSLVAVSMEVAAGGAVLARRKARPNGWFEPDEILPWVEQLCDALTYIHVTARLVHRDLKPGNLLLDGRDGIKVSDFGISSALSETGGRRPGLKPKFGTPAYMSPEQASLNPPQTSDDLYALGATLYDLLTGQPPFVGPSNEVVAQLQFGEAPESIAERRRALKGLDAPISQIWEDVIAALLARDPSQRPQSAHEVLERLRSGVARADGKVSAGRSSTPAFNGLGAAPSPSEMVTAFVSPSNGVGDSAAEGASETGYASPESAPDHAVAAMMTEPPSVPAGAFEAQAPATSIVPELAGAESEMFDDRLELVPSTLSAEGTGFHQQEESGDRGTLAATPAAGIPKPPSPPAGPLISWTAPPGPDGKSTRGAQMGWIFVAGAAALAALVLGISKIESPKHRAGPAPLQLGSASVGSASAVAAPSITTAATPQAAHPATEIGVAISAASAPESTSAATDPSPPADNTASPAKSAEADAPRPAYEKPYRGVIEPAEVSKAKTSVKMPVVIRFDKPPGAGDEPATGTMTQETTAGDLAVRFTGNWDGPEFRGKTGVVIYQPPRVRWEPEVFSITFRSGSTATYISNSGGDTYQANLELE